MLIEHIIDFIWGTWALLPNTYPYNCLLSWQNKNIQKKIFQCIIIYC